MALAVPISPETRQYQQAQQQTRAALYVELESLWRLMDPTRIDASFDARYGPAAMAAVRSSGLSMAGQATQYYRRLREGLGVDGEAPYVELAPISPEQLATSLLVTGPVAFKVGIRGGLSPERALSNAFVHQVGAATRIALDAGRNTILGQVNKDKQATGWARVTGAQPCAFCAMLASRGPVYKTAKTAGEDNPYHDHCMCTVEPVFEHNAPMTAQAQEYAQLWAESTAGLKGDAARNAFRAAVEGRTPSGS